MKGLIKEIAKLTLNGLIIYAYCIEDIAIFGLSFFLFNEFLHATGLAALGWLCLAILMFAFAWIILIGVGLLTEELK